MNVINITFAGPLKLIKDKYKLTNNELASILKCDNSTINRYLSSKIDTPYNKVQLLNKIYLLKRNDHINNYLFPIEDGDFYYHGSREGINFPINPNYHANKERKTKDFGKGFYLGESFKQSSSLVCGEINGNDRIDKFAFDKSDLKEKELKEYDKKYLWVLYIAYNRGKLENISVPKKLLNKLSNLSNNIDIISGQIADDSMSPTMDKFLSGGITVNQLIRCISRLSIGKQYCLKTEKACSKLRLVAIYRLGKTMRQLIKDYNLNELRNAIDEADRISYKKDETGDKYDEILKRACEDE